MPGFDPNNLGGLMSGLQAQMQQMQARAAATEVEGQAGNGLVKVVANGAQEVLRISIAPQAMEDRELLEDLVAAAVNDAMRNAKEVVAGQLGAFAGAMGLPPGLLG
ncbi:YbaB/EbfC family nucleoid-associated protein [Myxococcota bacterium]|nr:YbaB/EbfC family nucleoid-associated protein [Myxococcota bacterium]